MTVLPYGVVSQDGKHLDVEAVQGNFDALGQADDGALRIMAGTVFPVYAASSVSPTVTIPHGFGVAARAVQVTVANGGHIGHGSSTSTDLAVFSETRDGAAATGPVAVNYVAYF